MRCQGLLSSPETLPRAARPLYHRRSRQQQFLVCVVPLPLAVPPHSLLATGFRRHSKEHLSHDRHQATWAISNNT